MKIFDESTLLESGMSVVDFIAEKSNQKKIMKEIASFGDDELQKAFEHLFAPPVETPYETGSEAVTANEIAQMKEAPDRELQKSIARSSSVDAVRAYVERFKFSYIGEMMLLQRNDKDLLKFYFSRYPLYNDIQVLLARSSSEKMDRHEVLLAYVAKHNLCAEALAEVIRHQMPTVLEAYLKRCPLGYGVFDFLGINGSAAQSKKKIDFLLPFLVRPQDKLTLALAIRQRPCLAKIEDYAFCRDVSDLLRELTTDVPTPVVALLTPEERKVLWTNRNVLIGGTGEEMLRHNLPAGIEASSYAQ